MSALFGVELEQGEEASLLLLLLLYTLQGVPMGISSSVSFILQVRLCAAPVLSGRLSTVASRRDVRLCRLFDPTAAYTFNPSDLTGTTAAQQKSRKQG
jgi:hypothetical protein